jgi:hypothetical protein
MMRRHFASFAVTAVTVLLTEGLALAADPTTADCLAASEASLKSGNDQKLRQERTQLLVCASANCPADIRKECVHRVDEVNAAIPTIIFEAKDGSGKDLSSVKVTMDGQILAERLEGSALSIDPGEHTFLFETAGQAPLTKQFVIRESQKDRREAITFGADVASPTTSSEPTGAPQTLPLPQASEPSHALGPQRIGAIVAGGVGVVGVAVGSVFGLVAMSKKNDAQNVCPSQCATPDGVSKWSDAKSAGTISTVAFIVGGVGLAGGAILWFTAKPTSDSAANTQLGMGLGTVQLKGTW